MGADRIDNCRLLTDEQMSCAMEHQTALLFGCLRWHKPHVGPGHSFANGLRVRRIVLLPLDVRFYVSWRHKAHGMPKRLQFARPIMRGGAGFDADQTGLQFLEERQNIATLHFAANNYIACRIDAVNLKNRLSDIKTDRRDCLHGKLLRIVGPLTAPTSMAL